jgi:hypothetical protein
VKVMDRGEWYVMLMTCHTRYLPSRCCGRTIYYRYDGDEWCDDHRCTAVTRSGDRCSRKENGARMCSQHFSRGIRTIIAEAAA